MDYILSTQGQEILLREWSIAQSLDSAILFRDLSIGMIEEWNISYSRWADIVPAQGKGHNLVDR